MLYLIASWVIMQGADLLFSTLGLPETWIKLVLALLILGFSVVLIFSRVFELTAEGLKRPSLPYYHLLQQALMMVVFWLLDYMTTY